MYSLKSGSKLWLGILDFSSGILDFSSGILDFSLGILEFALGILEFYLRNSRFRNSRILLALAGQAPLLFIRATP